MSHLLHKESRFRINQKKKLIIIAIYTIYLCKYICLTLLAPARSHLYRRAHIRIQMPAPALAPAGPCPCLHPHPHSHSHAGACARTHTRTPVPTLAPTHPYPRSPHTCSHARTPTPMLAHPHARTRTCTPAHALAHQYSHTLAFAFASAPTPAHLHCTSILTPRSCLYPTSTYAPMLPALATASNHTLKNYRKKEKENDERIRCDTPRTHPIATVLL
jgi:hypothetical protein